MPPLVILITPNGQLQRRRAAPSAASFCSTALSISLLPRCMRCLDKLLDARAIQIQGCVELNVLVPLAAALKKLAWIGEFSATNKPEFYARLT